MFHNGNIRCHGNLFYLVPILLKFVPCRIFYLKYNPEKDSRNSLKNTVNYCLMWPFVCQISAISELNKIGFHGNKNSHYET